MRGTTAKGSRRRSGRATSPLAVALVALGSAAAAAADWGTVADPSPPPARAIGSYSLGCLVGGAALPAVGPGWRVMRPARERFYGHPELLRFVRELAEAARAEGLPGDLLVGDLAQPRGGPMVPGHLSHQTGLDVDIWFRPAPARPLAPDERETLPATSVVADGGAALDPERWTEAHVGVLRAAARDPAVARVFVNPVIKRALCTAEAAGTDRAWLRKIRPWWGHDDHFHVRLRCPDGGDGACIDQAPPPPGDGCDASLAWWFSPEAEAEAARLAAAPPPRRPTLDELPPQCRPLLAAEP